MGPDSDRDSPIGNAAQQLRISAVGHHLALDIGQQISGAEFCLPVKPHRADWRARLSRESSARSDQPILAAHVESRQRFERLAQLLARPFVELATGEPIPDKRD